MFLPAVERRLVLVRVSNISDELKIPANFASS